MQLVIELTSLLEAKYVLNRRIILTALSSNTFQFGDYNKF